MSTIAQLQELAGTYGILAIGFDQPRAPYWDALEGHSLAEIAAVGGEGDLVFPQRSQDQREAEYFSTFEAGVVPLYEGSCRPQDGREGLQEELLRFYHFFGVKLNEGSRDFPDHFVTELQFMRYLVELEAETVRRGMDPTPFRAGQRDFLERHIVIWSEAMRARGRLDQVPAYRILNEWLRSLAASHLDALTAICADRQN